jgi:hypothetical protein
MKKLSLTLLTLSLILLLSSCGINSAMILNHNQSATQVQLGSNNYKVVQRVSGSADVTYVLIFGGLNKKQLYDNAYTDMVNKANLMNGARALANIVTEEHVGGVPPFYYKRTVTVSAHVIEFTR